MPLPARIASGSIFWFADQCGKKVLQLVSRSVVFLAERLECELEFVAFVGQLKPHVLLVAFGRNTSSFVWGWRIQDGIYEFTSRAIAGQEAPKTWSESKPSDVSTLI